ncbi:MAG: low molecular weight phosphotyrosine protein phosphatase [Gammaproteobacteria bacterium]|nr:low molecular weight phosphotyrosine protein phosphatase [Gammaproteobacteria bacterium]
MVNKILVVCIGNICRSPSAEGFFSDYFKKRNLRCQINSAGIQAMEDCSADSYAQEVMLEKYGIDISPHRAKQLTENMLVQYDLVLTMDDAQRAFICKQFPFSFGKTHRLGQWTKKDISDPYRCDKRIFEERIERINECVNSWMDRLQ